MASILIPLTNLPSRNRDIELKYTLRSLPPHDKLYIIGRNPELQNIINIPFADSKDHKQKSRNIYNKIMKGFEYMDEMYFHADDHFISKEFNYQYFYDGELKDKLVPSTAECYKETIKNTIAWLNERNLPTKFFNVHCPVYYRKELFPFIDSWPDHGYCIKTIYCNYNRIEGVHYPDLKIKWFYKKDVLMKMLEGRLFFSTDDEFINRTFLDALSSFYPQASRYELASREMA